MKISQDVKLGFDDVMIVPRRSNIQSRSEVDLIKSFQFYHSPRKLNCIPVICANMASIAGANMAKELAKQDYITCLHKYISPKEIADIIYYSSDPWKVFVSIGMKEEGLLKIQETTEEIGYSPNICIDVPNGYIDIFVEFCVMIRDHFPESIIMAGNVVTPEAVQELIIHGKVDIVKLGIGPGSQCLTSKVTGVGYPQISCAHECSIVAHGLKSEERRLGLVCLDGGYKHVGDLAKGFCAGADFCMTGSMFAGTDECCGEWVTSRFSNKKHALKHYGMSSHYAQEKHEGNQKNYRASEGQETIIKYKGPVSKIITEINGGLRSTGAYIGANTIKDFNKCGSFVRIA